jgi:hypothetical protein
MQQLQRLRVMNARLLQGAFLKILDQAVVGVAQLQVSVHARAHHGIGKASGHTVALLRCAERSTRFLQVVLVERGLDVRVQFGSLAHEEQAPSHQAARGAQARRIHVRLRNHAAAQQRDQLGRVEGIVLGLGAVDRFEVKCMREHERMPCCVHRSASQYQQ